MTVSAFQQEHVAGVEAFFASLPPSDLTFVKEDVRDPQVIARGMQIEVRREDGSVLPGLRTPIRFSDAELALGRAAPSLPPTERA